MKKAILLLSGGLDSATVAAICKDLDYEIYALTFDYGQRHKKEIDAAKKIAAIYTKEHKIAYIDLRLFGGSALTADIALPKSRDISEIEHGGVPITYVPARNSIFLAYALAWAEAIGAYDIFLGVNAVDYSGYPDCRPDFVSAFERLANLATKAADGGTKYKVYSPLIHMTKSEIILTGTKLGVDYSITMSCYDIDDEGKACGICDSCLLRKKGFEESKMEDKTLYR